MGAVTTATVATANGSRYLQQLCKHWSHKFAVDFTPEAGTIALPFGKTTLAATPEALTVTIDAAEAEALPRAKQVVAEHLDRFAFREAPLPFEWVDA
ncbi:DUF2218 domain-containing protein [Sphingomonas naphthae]|uniref:DUF2218 domain-containing protein n=1 Tax=Sphingomonas naphthae TaxID=1813468 RepID=A0ABY7TGN8_9SPHN|nr:DUF2218 domain-containing protein [Sphingomonas naphthae]WCT72141.1 DUF2218 domain-containing protein [Sphingomonas naphthae]